MHIVSYSGITAVRDFSNVASINYEIPVYKAIIQSDGHGLYNVLQLFITFLRLFSILT